MTSSLTPSRCLTRSTVLDPFHVVKLGIAMLDEVRRRVQQETLGHRGHNHDPLYRIRNVLRAGVEHLTQRQHTRISTGLADGDPNLEVTLAWQVYQRLRLAYAHPRRAAGLGIALRLLAGLASCPVPEIARLGRTLRQWRRQFLAHFTTRASNGGTEAVNGIIELHRCVARGFRNPTHYRLRMLLTAGKLNHRIP